SVLSYTLSFCFCQTTLPGCSFSIASTQAVTYRSRNHPNPPPLPPSSLQSTIPAQIRAERQEGPGMKRLTAQSKYPIWRDTTGLQHHQQLTNVRSAHYRPPPDE
ncbi:hypothetical protein CSHISOI_00450, partial [Colletotrichum shisoi]